MYNKIRLYKISVIVGHNIDQYNVDFVTITATRQLVYSIPKDP